MSKIPKERKITYYIGIGMMVLGFILFLSVFFAGFNFMNNPEGVFHSFKNAPIGMVLIIIGAILMNIGAKGAAGSGLLLDPDKAREDLKPFNEAKGEIINDVISNIDVVGQMTKAHEQKDIIKIKCRNCGSLNEEDAKFCKSCGKEL